MFNRLATGIIAGTAAVLTLAAVTGVRSAAGAQAIARAAQRFTFTIPTAGPQATSDQHLELMITRWSTDAERQDVLTALKEGGPKGLTRAIGRSKAVGYIHWPGNIEYTLRYAWRVPRPDGGVDLVLATDTPVSEWWNRPHASVGPADEGTVIEVRVDKDGRGEGKLASADKVTEPAAAKTFVLSDYDKMPAVLTDVRAAHAAS